ncbi:hypothetical protein [uncultured Martelella sp.]|uniref:hypothetical protein n=1 Tax=uncultured Martelella sp. TaxID=392331 RepID=UPI0029C6FDD4|nr:hypothetical protein [uncultured Martelella sp.]
MNTHFREGDSFVSLLEVTPELRKGIEQTVEQLIALLDLFDGDENSEDDGTAEPLNGWPNGDHFPPHSVTNALSCDDDRENDNADYEDNADCEPWLGWTVDGETGSPCDADLESNGDEQEPLCGWSEGVDQTDPKSRETTRPQEWSSHSGFDGSGERVGMSLLREKVGDRAAQNVAQTGVRAWRHWSGTDL